MQFRTGHLCLLMCLCCASLFAKEQEMATLTVQGHAVVRRPVDELHLTLGVISQGKTAKEAIKINSQKMEGVLQVLLQLGLTSSEYQTSRFTISPLYSIPPKNPPPDWTATINGYEVTNQIEIRTEQMALAGPIIDNTAQLGINSVQNISFHLKNHREHYAEAIDLATKYALEDAERLAHGVHVELLRIIEIVLEKTGSPFQPRTSLYRAANMADTSEAIAPGEVDVTADVSIIYEIR